MLPENGPAWHKLRSNDLSDVGFCGASHELVALLQRMLDKNPDRRMDIQQVAHHPLLVQLSSMLKYSMMVEETYSTTPLSPTILGAVLPEAEGWLYNLFSELHILGEEDVSKNNDADDERTEDDHSMELD